MSTIDNLHNNNNNITITEVTTRSGSVIGIRTHPFDKYFHTLAIQCVWYIGDLDNLCMILGISYDPHIVLDKKTYPRGDVPWTSSGPNFCPDLLLQFI